MLCVSDVRRMGPPPVVSGISPREGPPGTNITIRGEHLGVSPQVPTVQHLGVLPQVPTVQHLGVSPPGTYRTLQHLGVSPQVLTVPVQHLGVSPWKSRLFWAPNDTCLTARCHFTGPKSRFPGSNPLPLALVMHLPASKS